MTAQAVAPMTDEQLEFYEELGRRWTEHRIGTILSRRGLTDLTAEVRRLKRENHLLHLSRGVPSIGDD